MTLRTDSPSANLNRSRSPKRIKLESSDTKLTAEGKDTLEVVDGDHCSICLQHVVDRTVLPRCAHEFCFECILVWTEQSRRCPLCSQVIADYLIHHIRSKYDYQKHYLTPFRTSPPPLAGSSVQHRRPQRREQRWGRTRREIADREHADELERAIAKRRWIYEHGLYAKHVASNSFTRYRPYPTPAQFAASQDLISRTTMFLRRELRVWINLDVEFLTTFILSLMKSIDIRSESAVKLLAEFLDMDAENGEQNSESRRNAEHFAHELYSYLRSPYRDLSVYDSVVQYDTPADVPAPMEFQRSRRWRCSRSRSRSKSRSRPRSRSRSRSRSPYQRRLSSSDHSRPQTRSGSTSSSRRKPNQKSSDKRTRNDSRDSSASHRSRSHSHGRHRRLRNRGGNRHERRRGDRESRYSRDTAPHNDKGKKKDRGRMDTPMRSSSPQAIIAEMETVTHRKNKQDADVNPRVDESGPFTSNSVLAQSPIAETLINVDETAHIMPKAKSRPFRNQGLLESVQAHLNGGRSKVQRFIDIDSKDKDKDKSGLPAASGLNSISEAGPSSLMRLSDGNVISPEPDTQNAQPTQETEMELQRPRLSAPQIMARTRARLAKLKNEHVAGFPPSAVPNSDSGGVNIVHGAHEATRLPSTDDNVRTRLLNRLEEERRRIPQDATVLPDPAQSVVVGIDLGAELDPQAAEAKLRMQAQVRVRLAAAKRAVGGHPVPVKCNTRVDVNGITEGATFVQREESLRARLKGRQN